MAAELGGVMSTLPAQHAGGRRFCTLLQAACCCSASLPHATAAGCGSPPVRCRPVPWYWLGQVCISGQITFHPTIMLCIAVAVSSSALPLLCPPQTADISAQNLGDEGFAYVVDALSFNDRCAAGLEQPGGRFRGSGGGLAGQG